MKPWDPNYHDSIHHAWAQMLAGGKMDFFLPEEALQYLRKYPRATIWDQRKP